MSQVTAKKERLQNFFATMVSVLATLSAGMSMAGINDGLVAYYTFDVAGDPGHDDVGSLDATEVVGVTQVAGMIGQAGLFTNGWMQLPDVAALDLLAGDFTFAVFVKGAVDPNNRNWFTKSNPLHHRYGLGGNDVVAFGFNGGPGGFVLTTSTVFDETWHHIVGIKRGTTAEIWFDGVLEGSGPMDSNFVDDGAIAIGRNGQCCEYFNGYMDDARIYNRALSAGEVAQLAGINYGLVAHWPLDGNADDATGNGYDGVVVGDVAYETGVLGGAATFDGIDDRITITGKVPYQNEFTFSGWIRLAGPPQNNAAFVFVKAASCNLAMQSLTYVYSDQYIHVDVADFGDPWYLRASVALEIGQWYHLCATVRPGEVRIYLDGAFVAEEPLTGTIDTDSCYIEHVIGGAAAGPLGGPWSHNGAIDDVRVYDRALTAGEVGQLAQPTFVPLVYADGFESGSTSNWSATVPPTP